MISRNLCQPRNFQFSPNFLDLPAPPPLPSSVYKRSPGNGGQRCSFGLAGSSPSNLRLAPSLLRPLHHLAPTPRSPTMATWLRLAENSSHHREKRIGRAWTRITGSLSLSVSVSLSVSLSFPPPPTSRPAGHSSIRKRVPKAISSACTLPIASKLPRIRVCNSRRHVSPDMRPRSLPTVPFYVHSVYGGCGTAWKENGIYRREIFDRDDTIFSKFVSFYLCINGRINELRVIWGVTRRK